MNDAKLLITDKTKPLRGPVWLSVTQLNVFHPQVKFARRMRVPEENCVASRDYIHICLEEEENKETIIPGGAWRNFRPDTEIAYNEGESWSYLLC